MKLYYAPLACSLADHIALREAGLPFEPVRVNLRTRLTETGADFRLICEKGYVPALVLETGETITENVAVLDWIAHQVPHLGVEGPLGRTRLLEALTYITTEIHHAYKPMWHGGGREAREAAGAQVARLLQPLARDMRGDFLFGDRPSVADFYLFVMLLWAEKFGVTVPSGLEALRERMRERPAVQAAMAHEGLI